MGIFRMFNNYAQYYDLFNSDKPYKKEIEFIYRWAKKPEWIFDIGCGTAEYWKYFPKHVEIYGIEKSKEMIKNSKFRNRINCLDVSFMNQPVDEFYKGYDLATALFDVLNYVPKLSWFKNVPVGPGGYFIFDIWDTNKVSSRGFKETIKNISGIERRITPLKYDKKTVDLKIEVSDDNMYFSEKHKMYLHTEEDIVKACGKEFDIVDIKPTQFWQTWYKCKKK